MVIKMVRLIFTQEKLAILDFRLRGNDKGLPGSPMSFPRRRWFDWPFDRLTVLSNVEGLTVLSVVEGLTTLIKVEGKSRNKLA